MKFALFLMGEKGRKSLKAVIEKHGAGIISCVVVAKDNNVQNDYSKEIINICVEYKILYYDRNELGLHQKINAEYAFSIGWRWIINIDIKLIVIHDSILPKYRGFSPLVNMLINGESEIGVTALFASNKYDEGDIIHQLKTNIDYPLKISCAIDIISNLYANTICDIIEEIKKNKYVQAIKQDANEASYSIWRDQEDYRINWSWSSDKIKRMIDAVGFPYSGAKCFVGQKEYTVLNAELIDDVHVEDRDSAIGKVIFNINNSPVIICGKGLIKLTEVLNTDTKSVEIFKTFRMRFK